MSLEEQMAALLLPHLQKAQAAAYGIKADQVGVKHDASGTPIAIGYSHGPGGVFTFPGVDQKVMHTVVGNIGILGQLPTTPSVFTNPVYQIITGVQDSVGAEKVEVCDNAPTAGLIKTCKTTAPFGRYERATGELELNRLGQQNDRADPMDLTLQGSPIAQSGIFTTGPGDPATPTDLLNNEVSRKFWELAIALHRLLSIQLWQGDPANNSAGGGSKELTGFDQLINTGYVDVETGTACVSVDSDLKDFNFQRIDDFGTQLVDNLSYMVRTRRDLAFRTGVAPVRFVLAMRPELFWELTAVWPCSYLTYRCQLTGNERLNIDGAEQTRMRDEMRVGRFLLIDGERIDVVLDDGIALDTTTTNANVTEGCSASDIYLIPMSILGGQSVTFMEYFDYTNPSAAAALADNLTLGRVEGPWITTARQTNWCIVWQTKVEPRLVMRTPWLAARLQNVMYCPLQNARQPFPDDPYFIDGGVTNRPGPSHFALWQD
jgi:hypothetical protein